MAHVHIGYNDFRGTHKPIEYAENDRLRHMYMVGKTGVGKSTVFQNMCLQDIRHGHGACFIDPHGDSVEWLLRRVPRERLQDVIVFDPSDTAFPFALNLLEAHDTFEKDFLVNECIQIFYKLFDPDRTGVIGPQFEHWLRNAALTVMADPEGGTLLEIPRLFIDAEFEKKKRSHLTDPLVIDFWIKQMAQTASFHKSEMLNYFTSKFGPFINNAMMRNILGQRMNSFDFNSLMDGKKILLVNLSKGKVGETNAHLLGLILVSRIQAAILKRANQKDGSRTPFYLYVDEFQNFTTDTFASMLSESRKYGLGLHIANQYLSQLPETIRDSVFGNVGTMLVFEVGVEDAKMLAREFAPITEADFLGLPRFHFYIKLMTNGKTSEAFSGTTPSPEPLPDGPPIREKVLTLNRLAYAWPRAVAEATVRQGVQ